MNTWWHLLKPTLIGAATGTAFGLAAFLFLTTSHDGMGGVLFLLVPIAAGFAIGLVARGANSAGAAAILAVLSSLLVLVGTGKEGALCVVLVIPILLLGLFIGVLIGVAARAVVCDLREERVTTMGVLLLVLPAVILAADRVEAPHLIKPRVEVIRDSVTVSAPPDQVWKDIVSIDSVRASKPFLMYVGLPIPERCSLQGEGVGAKRTCYFNSGYIEETITGWNPPYYMGLTIDRTHMPGRHWLGFENAEYRLQANGKSTVLTRTTTISSHLLPRWYWRPLERLGVESEHLYILQDVKMRAGNNSFK